MRAKGAEGRGGGGEGEGEGEEGWEVHCEDEDEKVPSKSITPRLCKRERESARESSEGRRRLQALCTIRRGGEALSSYIS